MNKVVELREAVAGSVNDGDAVALEATGWELKVAEDLQTTEPPTDKELEVLRDLKARTEASRRKS